MKDKFKLFGLAVLVTAIVFSFAACKDSDSDPTSLRKAGLYAKAPGGINGNDTPIDVSSQTGDNIIAKAVAYANASSGTGGRFTLLLDTNESTGPITLTKDALEFNIKGLDSTRTITLTSDGSLFTVNTNGHLILWDKITLRGRNNNSDSLIYVQQGKLTMKAGSTITGNDVSLSSGSGGGVQVANSQSTFEMEGGTISGNTATDGGGGGVYVMGTGGNRGTFNVNPPAGKGNISSNTATAMPKQVAKDTGDNGGIIGGSGIGSGDYNGW